MIFTVKITVEDRALVPQAKLVRQFRESAFETRLNHIITFAETSKANGSGEQIQESDINALKEIAAKFKNAASSPKGSASIEFGQLRVANHFQAASVNNQDLPLQPAGKPVKTVADQLKTDEFSVPNSAIRDRGEAAGRESDELPLQVFPHIKEDGEVVAVAINNRGLATDAIANTEPKRILPRMPDALEVSRLDEREGKDDVKFTDRGGLRENHSVPSDQAPITEGKGKSQAVEDVANVPKNWKLDY